jgi:hypothetical protein
MSSTPAIPTAVREGDRMTLNVGDRKLEVSISEAKHLARVINNVAPVFGDNATLTSQYIELIQRTRVYLESEQAETYLANTGRQPENGMVTGAYVHLQNGETWLADSAFAFGPGVLQLGTPLEERGHRVVPVGWIAGLSFDGE